MLEKGDQKMKVTIRDIAERAGVSPSAVSLVLNNRPARIPETTRARILAAASELGYRPNLSAIALKTNRSYTIGLIIPDIRNDYYATYAKGLEDACQEQDWSLILCSTNYNTDRERKYIHTLCQKNIDGISVVQTPPKKQEKYVSNMELIHASKIPCVQLDFTETHPLLHAVVADHEKGGYMATRHLLSLGHRNIAFITGPADFEGSRSRLNGCKKAFSEYGVPWREDLVCSGDYTYNSGLDGIDCLIDKKFTAVFAFNDLIAYGVYNGLAKYGLSVPDDISVV